MKKEWRIIDGGLYRVSNLGEVQTRAPIGVSKTLTKWRIRKTSISRHRSVRGGYESVGLVLNKKETRRYIHRLVFEYFVKPIPFGFFINHKDGNKLNNSLENLEIVTAKENTRHAIMSGLIVHKPHTKCRNGHSYIKNERENRSSKQSPRCLICYKASAARSEEKRISKTRKFNEKNNR